MISCEYGNHLKQNHELLDYVRYLSDRGRARYSDLTDDEVKQVTGLIMQSIPKSWLYEFVGDSPHCEDMLLDLTGYLVTFDEGTQEVHKERGAQLLITLTRCAAEYAETAINYLFDWRDEELASFDYKRDQYWKHQSVDHI